MGAGARHSLVDRRGEKTWNVFHTEPAVGSPLIPAQDEFVVPHGVRSVLGFGDMLETGDLYVVILFSKVPPGGRGGRCSRPADLAEPTADHCAAAAAEAERGGEQGRNPGKTSRCGRPGA